jgi:putative SOS response-associated peptidase YedK
MCGRYSIFHTWAEVHAFSQPLTMSVPAAEPEPRYNLAPTQSGWVIAEDDGHGLVARAMRWGLIPFWARDAKVAFSTFNARIETASSKPMFREAWKHRRCLVPASGYFEWQRRADSRTKQPYLIRDRGSPILMFAGLWERSNSPVGPVESYTIVTRDAEGPEAVLHDRRPVMLPPELLSDWIRGSSDDAAGIAMAAPDPTLTWHPVDPAVGNVRNQGPQLVQPIKA